LPRYSSSPSIRRKRRTHENDRFPGEGHGHQTGLRCPGGFHGPVFTGGRISVRNQKRDMFVRCRRWPCLLKNSSRFLIRYHDGRFVDKTPQEVYAALLDGGSYLCSVRTMYRILEACNEVKERRNQLRHPVYAKPELLAEGPNQVWSWDITKFKGPAKWTYPYLYVIIDIFSRYVVG